MSGLARIVVCVVMLLTAPGAVGTLSSCGDAVADTPPREDVARAVSAWPVWGFNAARTRVGPNVGLPAGSTPAEALWSKSETVDQFGDLLEYPPSIAGGRAFYCTNGGGKGGSVIAVSLADGRELWRYRLKGGGQFASQPAVAGGIVYVGTMPPRKGRGDPSYRPELLALRAGSTQLGGTLVWRRVLGRAVESSPLVIGDRLYFCTQRGTLYCFNRLKGTALWSRPLEGKTTSSPAFRDGRVIVSTYGGLVFAFDAKTGKRQWRSALPGKFYGTPAIYGNRVIVASLSNGRVYSLNARTGRMQWSYSTAQGLYASPAVYRGAIYLGSKFGGFWCLDAATGRPKWPKRKFGAPIYGSASVLGDTVYFSTFPAGGAKRGITFGVDAATGEVVWQFPDGCYSPVTATSNLILVTGHHTVYAFNPVS